MTVPSTRKPAARLALATLVALPILAACSSDDGKPRYTRLESTPTPANAAAPTPSQAATPTKAESPAGIAAATSTPPVLHSLATSSPLSVPPSAALPNGISAPPPVTVRSGGNILDAAGVAFTIPADWKQQPKPSTPIRLAQYELPGADGSDSAEAVVFYFGPGQGGTPEQNIKRWVGQFASEDSTTTALGGDTAFYETDGGLQVTLVRCNGAYQAGPNMMAMMSGAPPQPPAEPKKNWSLFGMVVQGSEQGTLFVKVTGPKPTLDAHQKDLEAFAQSARRSHYK